MKKRKVIWSSLIVMLVFVILSIAFGFFHACTIPPHSITYNSMHMCKRRILRYAQEHGKLPLALGETKIIEGFHSSIKDYWDAVLGYSVDTNYIVTLKSLGKDHVTGGDGDNIDMIGCFPAKQPDGSWSDEFVDWTQDPFEVVRREN